MRGQWAASFKLEGHPWTGNLWVFLCRFVERSRRAGHRFYPRLRCEAILSYSRCAVEDVVKESRVSSLHKTLASRLSYHLWSTVR